VTAADRDRLAPWICAALAVFLSVVAVGMILSSEDSNITSLLRMSPGDPIAQVATQIEPDLKYVPAGHYDGVYYYAIAIDPLATGDAHRAIDLASHRYGHPGYGWLAWLTSFGQPSLVPEALLLLNLVGMGAGAYAASLLSRRLGLGPWGGLLVALNPGLLFSVTTDTSEPVTITLLAVGLLLWLDKKEIPGAIVLAVTCFFKFQMLLVPVALGLWELVRFLRGDRHPEIKRRIGVLAVGPIIYLVWLRVVYAKFGDIPTSGGPEFLSFPFVGWLDTMSDLGKVAQMGFQDVQLASAELPILIVLLAAFTYGIVRSARLRHPMDAVFLLQGLFVLLLNWWNLLYPKDLLRALAIPIPLLIAILFLGRARSEPEIVPTEST
jgi:hypothetical protein